MGDSNFLELEEPKGSDEKKEELILGRFKTPDELANAYKELEGEFTRKSQALSEKERLLESQARVQTPPVQPNVEEDINDLFFQEPKRAVEQILAKALDPLISASYLREKETLRANPEFVKYESEIDTIVSQMPNLKSQPGIVGQLFKMVKGLHFDDTEYEKGVRAKILAEQNNKQVNSLESGDPPPIKPTEKLVNLTAEEKRVARKFNPQLEPEEAYKKYAEKKAKFGGGA